MQYTINKSVAANRTARHPKGISLEMLAQASMLGADSDDPNCSTLVTDIVEAQEDVVSFVQSLTALRERVVSCRDQLVTAAQAGQLAAFGEENTSQLVQLLSGVASVLDVFTACPSLAPHHQPVPEQA